MILLTAAFDQPTALLFLDDGVFQLKSAQQPAVHGLKDTAAIFKALELYEVHELFVESESLQERGIRADDLLLLVKLVPRSGIAALMQRYDVIIGN